MGHEAIDAGAQKASSYSVQSILAAIKAAPYLQDLIRIAELAEITGNTSVVCPFCGVIRGRGHQSDCLVTEARQVLQRVEAANWTGLESLINGIDNL